jgi:hypothetical protein
VFNLEFCAFAYLGFKLGSVERRNSLVVVKAVGDKSESSSGNIGKSVQSAVSFFMCTLNCHTDSPGGTSINNPV